MAGKKTGRIIISLQEQRLCYVNAEGVVMMVCPTTTGRGSLPTPQGSYFVEDRMLRRVSQEFPGAVMLWCLLLSGGRGFCIHQGTLFGLDKDWDEGSHGCIRLDWYSAMLLYSIAKKGDTIEVRQEFPTGLLGADAQKNKGGLRVYFAVQKPKGLEGVCEFLSPLARPYGDALVGRDIKVENRVLTNNIIALILDSSALTWEYRLTGLDPRVRAFLASPHTKAFQPMFRPVPRGQIVKDRLFGIILDGCAITISADVLNSELEKRQMPRIPDMVMP